jgi:hypothetical protein
MANIYVVAISGKRAGLCAFGATGRGTQKEGHARTAQLVAENILHSMRPTPRHAKLHHCPSGLGLGAGGGSDVAVVMFDEIVVPWRTSSGGEGLLEVDAGQARFL